MSFYNYSAHPAFFLLSMSSNCRNLYQGPRMVITYLSIGRIVEFYIFFRIQALVLAYVSLS